MADYRICPGCGKRNPVNVAICGCNTILLNCQILTDDEGGSASQTLFGAANNATSAQTGQENTICGSYGHQNKANAKFCVKCGQPLASFPAAAQDVQKAFCPNCGNQVKPGTKSCVKCGNKLEVFLAPVEAPRQATDLFSSVPVEEEITEAPPAPVEVPKQTADLFSSVLVEDEITEAPPAPAEEPERLVEATPHFSSAAQASKKYKQCPECGHLNDPQAETCFKCGETLEDVFDLIEAPEQSEQSEEIPEPKPLNTCPFYFISTEGVRADIPLGKSVFGRGAIMGEDIVKRECFFVSEEHFTVTCTPEYVEIIDISRNGTFVNDNKITKGISVKLNQGDLVGMGGVSKKLDPRGYFITLLRNS